MSALTDLFGDKLRSHDGEEIDVESLGLSKEGFFIGFYSCAKYCGACIRVTPILVEWYNDFQEKYPGKLEIIYASGDITEANYEESCAKMPWLALPYAGAEGYVKLSKKLDNRFIPNLTFIDSVSGEVICRNGCYQIEHGCMDEFPWPTQQMSEIVKGPLLSPDGEVETPDPLEGKVTGFFLSGTVNERNQRVAARVVKTYNKLKADEKNFEVVLLSWAETRKEFDASFAEMPWLAVPFGDHRPGLFNSCLTADGTGSFHPGQDPLLVIYDETMKLITDNGVETISGDPDGKDFPWAAGPLKPLTGAYVHVIDAGASVVYLTGGDEAESEKATAIMNSIAEEYVEDYKEKVRAGVDEDELWNLRFFVESPESGYFVECLRSFYSIDEPPPVLVALYWSTDKAVMKQDSYTSEDIKGFINSLNSRDLEVVNLREDDGEETELFTDSMKCFSLDE